ncbi:MAG: histidine kinase [Pyrinomonadaceae bacterium]|nr:histidine kinase [Pyrinomonadaceae bacterium]
MYPIENKKDPLQTWLAIFAGWTFVALVFAFTYFFQGQLSAKSIPFGRFLLWQIASCYVWFLLTPLILLATTRFLPEGKRFYRNLVLLVLSALGILALQLGINAFILPPLGFPSNRRFDTFFEAYQFMVVSLLPLSVMLYLMTTGAVFVSIYYRKYRNRELINSQIEGNLTKARLQVLQMQLRPHFLFNTHNVISQLIHKDPDSAERLLNNLNDLLQNSVERYEEAEIPLKRELEFIEKYLEIEQVRFGERLNIEMKIDPDAPAALVPYMILLPLIENAVKHGISPQINGGKIEIVSRKEGEHLLLKVADNGVGIANHEANKLSAGIGLVNTKSRLLHLYQDRQTFEIYSEDQKGFLVRIKIPFKRRDESVRNNNV